MTTGRINQVSHSLPGPGPIARPPRGVHFSETGQCPARNCPASPSTATRSPPCSIIGNGQSRPPINGLPLLPSRSPATCASRNPPASRSTHAQHTHTHATPRPSTPLLDGSRPSRSPPINHVNRSQPACPSLAVYPRSMASSPVPRQAAPIQPLSVTALA